MNITTKDAYLPTTIISDKAPAFVSHVIKEVADVLWSTLEHAATKHGLTVGMLDRTKRADIRIETGERMSMWHKYVKIAVLN